MLKQPKTDRDVDTLIRDALGEEERELFDRLGDPTLPEMLGEVFRGRLRWLAAIVALVVVIFTGIAVYAAVQFFDADEVAEMIRWAGIFFFCMTAIMANKLWHWMEMQRYALTREIKRLELQIATLSESLRER